MNTEQWQPMETAPRDGTAFYARKGADGLIETARWVSDYAGWNVGPGNLGGRLYGALPSRLEGWQWSRTASPAEIDRRRQAYADRLRGLEEADEIEDAVETLRRLAPDRLREA